MESVVHKSRADDPVPVDSLPTVVDGRLLEHLPLVKRSPRLPPPPPPYVSNGGFTPHWRGRSGASRGTTASA
jgi:hypothetical protein